MQIWIEHLLENYSAQEIINVLDENIFDDIVTMKMLDCTGEEAADISPMQFEEMLEDVAAILLRSRKLSNQAVIDICNDYKVTLKHLVDDGTVIEYKGDVYEGEE